MLSKKMTFSLMSLITILALALMVTPVDGRPMLSPQKSSFASTKALWGPRRRLLVTLSPVIYRLILQIVESALSYRHGS